MLTDHAPRVSHVDRLRNLGLVGLGFLALATALRVFEVDHFLLLALIAVAPWVFLGLAIIVAGLTDWKAFVVVTIGVAALLSVTVPGTLQNQAGCDVSGSTAGVVVFSHNVLFGHADPTAVVSQISSTDADVIFFQEAVPEFVEAIGPLLGDYPYRELRGFQAVFSRWEITNPERVGLANGDTSGLLGTTVATPNGDVRLVNVHASPPHIPGGRESQQEQFGLLADSEASIPLLAMGDFNADPSDARYRSLVSEGRFIDAHPEVGCGFGVTWSPRPGLGPALLSLDHALVGQGAHVEAFEILDYAGSDHKAIAVRVSIAS